MRGFPRALLACRSPGPAGSSALAQQVHRNPRPLPVIKDMAYAWRHAIFYLSMPGADVTGFDAYARDRLEASKGAGVSTLRPVLAGLHAVANGRRFDTQGAAGDGRRLLGWAAGRHWAHPRNAADV